MHNNTFCIQDSILDGITFEDLLTAVISNEKHIDEDSIRKVFNEILKSQIEDAKHLLNQRMEIIKNETLSNRE